jgi:hypothetical protein
MKKISPLLFLAIIAFLIIFLLIGCTKTTNTPVTPIPKSPTQNERPDQYTNTQYGFTFKVCSDRDFKFAENYAGATVALLGPLLRDFKHQVGIYVILNKLPKNTTLEDYLKKQQSTAKTTLANFTIIDEKDITVGAIPAKLSQSTFTVSSVEGDINYRTTLAAFVKDGIVYAIQYETDAELYDEYARCFNTVLSTFQFN